MKQYVARYGNRKTGCCCGTHSISLCSDSPAPQHTPERRLNLGNRHLVSEGDSGSISSVSELPLLLVDELDSGDLPGLAATFVPLKNGDGLIQGQRRTRV